METPVNEANESVTEVLLCDRCRRSVFAAQEIIAERHPGPSRERVYAYALDLFENGREVCTYSATNGLGRRFDLVCARPTFLWPRAAADGSEKTVAPESGCAVDAKNGRKRQHASLVSLSGDYSPQDSFFVGYSWCFCHCRNCGGFLGWGFITNEKWLAYKAARDAATAEEAQAKRRRSECNDADEEENEPQTPPFAVPPTSDAASSTTGEGDSQEEDDEESEDAEFSCRGESDAGEVCEFSEKTRQVLPSRPSPDFLGIILMHCTGDSEFPAEAFAADVNSIAERSHRRVVVDALHRELTRKTSLLADYVLGHSLQSAFLAVSAYVLSLPLIRKEHCSLLAFATDSDFADDARWCRTRGTYLVVPEQARHFSPHPMLSDPYAHPRYCEVVDGALLPCALRRAILVASTGLRREAARAARNGEEEVGDVEDEESYGGDGRFDEYAGSDQAEEDDSD